MPAPLHILGRFPPPIDGQTMATERLAGLLADAYAVRRLSTSAPESDHVKADVRLRLGRVRHYLRLRRRLRAALAEAPAAPVLWASISPAPLGHLRDVAATLPAFAPGQPVHAVVHRGDFDRVFRHPLTAATARRLVRRLRGVVFLTNALADACAPWIPDAQRVVIPNTIDEAVRCTEGEVAEKQARRAAREELRLLFLSNMIPSKGYRDVLGALPRLRAQGLAVRADFVGRWENDADRAAFEAFVRAEGLAEHVIHHGGVRDRATIRRLYLEADVFLLPTYYPTEAQPLTILEALNAGTPVVATRHAGIPEMVREGEEALFVPPRDPEAVAEAVVRLADTDAWAGFSARARRRFVDAFSPEAVRQQWLALLIGA
ncbi:MAG: glycosyltransferase family 4 protein [Rhodothermales bacterium]|nr:glycosyltransferase family 4 protein [Rhodothermales bacterium]